MPSRVRMPYKLLQMLNIIMINYCMKQEMNLPKCGCKFSKSFLSSKQKLIMLV
ncbi:MAG TPA: hypothetical protein [Caudoviricetes sp.]|nr:MAG TPA: hypothetical protein [Caudoviricetes sp.]